MSRPRFEAIELEYGCHSGRFDLPDEARPVVIAGRNGSGKTTLLEALLRSLYGFTRRKPEERRLLDLRRPWSGRPVEARVWLQGADGDRYAVHRDFASDTVVARDESTAVEVFRGDGNPVGARSESRHYQDLVGEWIGFGTLEPYRGTAWIAQGELVDTKLDDELLRAAAGTHRRVEAALGELRDAFQALTREPLEPGGRGKRLSRELEELREAAGVAAERLEAARDARGRRRPLLERAGEVRSVLAVLDSEISLLEAAYRPITERRTLLAETREAEARLSAISEAIRWLEEAASQVARAEAEATGAEAGGRYPADFEARLGQAEILWDQLETLENRQIDPAGPEADRPRFPRSPIALAGAGLALVGTGVALTVSLIGGGILAVSGALLLAVAWWLTRSGEDESDRAIDRSRRLDGDRETARSRLMSVKEGIPAPELAAENVEEHRGRFVRQAEARAAVLRARERSDEAVKRAAGLLDPAASSPYSSCAEVLGRLQAAREESRTALARLQLRLEEQPATPLLPDGVESTVPALEAARDQRRTRRDALGDEKSSLDLDIRDLERASEDVFPLERELSGLRDRVLEAESEVSVRRFAWELVRDAYEQFRATDQDRLLAAVNRRLDQLSGGRLGPVSTAGDLASARVALAGRDVPLDSPPLSFGEKHVVLLAIRLGAADFLSGAGTHHPLLVDEPFTHLDEVRAREVWRLLQSLAEDRQVIITTQDRLVLDHLGIQPDLYLASAGESGHVGAQPSKSKPARKTSAEKEASEDPPASPVPAQVQLELG